MNKPLVAAFIAIAGLSFSACRKAQHIGVDVTLKADFEYATGSYWLYRDTATGQIDSLYFYRKGTNRHTSSANSNTYDQMWQELFMVNNTPGGSDTIAKWIIYMEEQRMWCLYVPGAFANISLNSQKNSHYGLSYPFATGIMYNAECKVDMLPSYTVNGIAYQNVARLYCLAQMDEDYVHVTRKQGMISIAQKHEGYETVTRTHELVKAVIVR